MTKGKRTRISCRAALDTTAYGDQGAVEKPKVVTLW
jgi:hypothetical protein